MCYTVDISINREEREAIVPIVTADKYTISVKNDIEYPTQLTVHIRDSKTNELLGLSPLKNWYTIEDAITVALRCANINV